MNKQERDEYLADTWDRLDDSRVIEPDEVRTLLAVTEGLEAENDLLIERLEKFPRQRQRNSRLFNKMGPGANHRGDECPRRISDKDCIDHEAGTR